MEEDQVADLWMLFKEYIDKKHQNTAAERFVELLSDHGVGDDVLRSVSETDEPLSRAISMHMDIEDWEEEN